MINIILCGANGKMGKTITRLVEERDDCAICAGVDINTVSDASFKIYPHISEITEKADVIIDFSHPSLLEGILAYSRAKKIPAVICTTGLSDAQREAIKEASKEVAMFFSANMSIGINLIISLAQKAAAMLEDGFDIEIVERHHNQKVDAPSGTALAIADAINDAVEHKKEYIYDRHSVRRKRAKSEMGIHAIRGGTIVGEHTVIFAGNDEVIELHHSAASKEVFAVGAIRAAVFLANRSAALYDMHDLIESWD